ncbi:MAG TPA: FAD/NAD(P)-binding oxidoreductase [Acidimicrobiales bacterium]
MSTLHTSDHVTVVGAGLAGWRFVESLRREGFDGGITLVGEEPYAPYDRPPLSKQVLSGKWTLDKATLATPEHLEESGATLRLGVSATKLDAESTTVHLSDGTSVSGTFVVVATGSRARQLSFSSSGPLPTLRNHDDAARLASTLDALGPEGVVVIIGGGFVGAEVATSLKTRGFTPVVLEAMERPLLSVVGEQASRWLGSLAEDAGIELRTNQQISDVRKVDGGFIVQLSDGSSIDARVVIAAVGSSLDLAWLESSGLTIDNGVVVDLDLQAAPRIAAIGDVARHRWLGATGEEIVRIEHWQVATDHAAHLAHFWMTGERSAPMVPYFWSDQYGKKIQMLGHPHPDDDVMIVSGSADEKKWLALYAREGVVTGALSLSQPRWLMLAKPLLDSRTSLANALASAPWSA